LHFETRKDGIYIDPFDDTRQLEFWVLSPDDQERLGMGMLSSSASSSSASNSSASIANASANTSGAQSGGAEDQGE
jgi:hypothetical protein